MTLLIKLTVSILSIAVFLQVVALYLKSRGEPACTARIKLLLTGFAANIADTLGIGSFAVMTAFNNRWNLVDDKKLPGTLNAHSVLPAMLQSLLFLNFVDMDLMLLVSFVLAACFGGLLSGTLVSRLDKQTIRLLMTLGFVGIGMLILGNQLHLLPVGGNATALSLSKFMIGIPAMMLAGMLPAIGAGLYVPIQIILFLLGLSPLAAFPIMTTAGAIVQSTTAYAFVAKGEVAAEESLVMTLSGLAGVAIAVPLVTYVNLSTLRWLLLAIVFYNALMLWRAYREEKVRLVEA